MYVVFLNRFFFLNRNSFLCKI